MNILFRVDADKRIGLGHLNRCLSIAEQLKIKNVTSIFAINNKKIEKDISKKGYVVLIKPKNISEIKYVNQIILQKNCKAIIIDTKRKSIKGLIKNLQNKIKIILIDNVMFSKYADLNIFPGAKELFLKIPSNSLVGLEYALLNPNISINSNFKKKNQIIVTTGGSDKKNITYKIIQSFIKNRKRFKVLIILGRFFCNEKEIEKLVQNDKRFKIYKDPKDFFQLMRKSRLGILTFGITVYEAAMCGLPSLVISHSNENSRSAKIVSKYGWSYFVGKFDKINYDELIEKAISLSKDSRALKKMIYSGKKIDGKGSKRIAKKIIDIIHTVN